MGQGLSCSGATSFNAGLGECFRHRLGLGTASGPREGNTGLHFLWLCPKFLFYHLKMFKRCLCWISNQGLGSIRTADTSSKLRLRCTTRICWEKGNEFHNCFLLLAHHYSPGFKNHFKWRKGKMYSSFSMAGFSSLLPFAKNIFKFKCENKLWVWTPVFEEIEAVLLEILGCFSLWKYISVVLDYVMTAVHSMCMTCLTCFPHLLGSWGWGLQKRLLNYLSPSQISIYKQMPNFYKFWAIFGVAVPWGCAFLQFENQDLGLKKKAGTEGSFHEGFMPESLTRSVGLPAFSSNNASH